MSSEEHYGRALGDFLSYLAAEKCLSKNTLQAYLRDVKAFLADKDGIALSALTADHIKEHLGRLKTSEYASSSVLRSLISLKVFFRFLKRERYVEQNVAQFLESPKIWQLLPEVLSCSEVERLLRQPDDSTADGACDKAVIELLYGAGLRVSELCSLNLNDVGDDIVIVKGKGGKQRVVPIGKKGILALDHYLTHHRGICKEGDKEPLLVGSKGKRLDRIDVWKRIKKHAKAAGIEKNISPHTLRHSFATHLLDNGADLRVIQEMMGHAHIGSTDRYMHLSRKGIKEKFHACHPRN